MMGRGWTAVVLTCRDCSAAQAYQKELLFLQQRGSINKDCIVLSVEDPKQAVGSGGATLNALLVVSEYISAQQGFTVVNGDVLQDAHILILHMGRDFPYNARGRAFVQVPMCPAADSAFLFLPTNLDLLLHTLSDKLAKSSPPGVWICSTDMFLDVPNSIEDFEWTGVDVCAVTVPVEASYATQHGVYRLNSDGNIQDILYKGDLEQVRQCATPEGFIPLVSGVIYVRANVAEKFLGFHVTPPMDACTYMGLDSGAQSIELSIFFDLLLAMCGGITQEEYIAGQRSSPLGKTGPSVKRPALVENARRAIWKELHGFTVKAWLIENGGHSYMDTSCHTHLNRLLGRVVSPDTWQATARAHSLIQPGSSVAVTSVLLNSLVEQDVVVGEGSAITNCHLPTGARIGHGCYLNGIPNVKGKSLVVPDGVLLECMRIRLPTLSETNCHNIYVAWGVKDNIMMPVSGDGNTFCGKPWKDFLSGTGINEQDLWDSDHLSADRSLYTASLYPVFHASKPVGLTEVSWLFSTPSDPKQNSKMLQKWRSSWRLSLKEILSFINIAEEFNHSRELFFSISQLMLRDVLLNQHDVGLNNLFTSAVIEGYAPKILHSLDTVAKECNSPGIAARTLANIADVLGAMAQGRGGLRSGPAANKQWNKAFVHLEAGRVCEGVQCLERVRRDWGVREDLLVRAARHYEGAAQILIRHAVMTGRQFINTSLGEPSLMEKWVRAECPARIDIAGGWSDTPPITYEHGGAVINAAICLDGKKPIGAKARRIPEPYLVLVMGEDEESRTRLVLKELSQLHDYNQPHAPGALLKAAFICTDIILYPSDKSLEQQLTAGYGGGFQLCTWSNLPLGSGLGASSILAGAVMAALWTASGKIFTIESLNHAVLHLEQMLTSGGGWQDQVGGLTGGIKVGHSPAKLPLQIFTSIPDINTQTVEDFSDRLVLVYTGRTRLARNLLQNVIRNWYARNPEIVETEDGLVENAWKCAKAFEKGDLAEVGECMNLYWQQKKKMAPGCEPASVSQMMEVLQPHIYGVMLAGAGGGGFMYVLTKEPHSIDLIKQVLSTVKGTDGITVHNATIDPNGLALSVQGRGVLKVKQSD